MKAGKILFGTLASFMLFTTAAIAQEETLRVNFEGTCRTTNASGRIITQPVNNRTLLREYARTHSITNINSLALVYHVSGDERGDVIEIVNASTGEVLADVLALFFAINLSNGDGSVIWRQTALFNSQQSDSIGTCLLKEQFVDRRGNPNHTITGQLTYHLAPNADHGTRLCTAHFTATKPFVPKSPPGITTALDIPLKQLLLAKNR